MLAAVKISPIPVTSVGEIGVVALIVNVLIVPDPDAGESEFIVGGEPGTVHVPTCIQPELYPFSEAYRNEFFAPAKEVLNVMLTVIVMLVAPIETLLPAPETMH